MEGKWTKFGSIFTIIGVLIALGFGVKQLYDSAISSAIQQESLRLEKETNQKLEQANQKLEQANKELISANQERKKATKELEKANKELRETRKDIDESRKESINEIREAKTKIEISKQESAEAINKSEYRLQLESQKDRVKAWKKRMQNKGWIKRHDDIKIKNICNLTVRLAVCYKDLEDSWVTEGWWSVEPYQTITTSVKSRGTEIYFYAESGDIKWNGDGAKISSHQYVVSESFVALEGYRLYGNNKRRVNFYGVKVGNDYQVYTQSFGCE